MRILTARQPWAWAIIHGGKDVENRVRNIAGGYRGPVAIHTAKTGASFDAKHPELWPFDERHIPGVIIGVVDLDAAHVTCPPAYDPERGLCSPWAEPDVWHLHLSNPRALAEPIPYKGALGLRRLDPETILAITRQIGRTA